VFVRPNIFPPHVVAAQSCRGAIVYDPTKDDKEKLLFLGELGVDENTVVSSKQVHENKVLVATHPHRAEGYDAIITNRKNIYVMVATADCTPILIYDKKNSAVAAIHAGWRGTVANIVLETLNAMRDNYGTRGDDCLAFIGACISEKKFEVGEEVAEKFDDSVKRFDPVRNKFFVDLKKANYDQLIQFGLLSENIEISNYCTIEDNDKFYSYRKEKGKTGRMYALIGIRSS
jgi:polyphenol oxidase